MYGQFQVIDWVQEDWIDFVFLFFNDGFVVVFEVYECCQLLLQDGSGVMDSFFGIQGVVGFQVQDQFVQVGVLFDMGVFYYVGDMMDWVE